MSEFDTSFLESQIAECLAACQQLRYEIDQARSMIPLVGNENGGKGASDAPEYICGDDSNIVFTPVDGGNQVKLDVYYV